MEITIKLNGSNEEVLNLVKEYNKEILNLLKEIRKEEKSSYYVSSNYPFDVMTSSKPEEKK